ncbi:MAG: DUF1211 domain-containing protein [Acidimicrobiales bacterium]|nr:DUF1211 domain-containing protein [Acidimicrobiales bacterium]
MTADSGPPSAPSDARSARPPAGATRSGGSAVDDVNGTDDDAEEPPGIDRLLALSDGVVAIALTLLVLQLRVPATSLLHDTTSAPQLADRLRHDGDQLISYLVAFYVVARFWLAHHRLFRQMTGHDEILAWWNFAFLMAITLVSFTSDLLGQYGSNPLAVNIFGLNLLLAGLTSIGTMAYARRSGLVREGVDPGVFRIGQVRTASLSVAVVISMAVAWVDTDAAKFCWLLIAILPIAARHLAPDLWGDGH